MHSMSVTGVSPTRSLILLQIERLTGSNALKGSESLCRLLRYFAERFVGHPGETLKEHQIAMEVFGRGSDFDPRLDATVRVHTSRLRSKMAEYYALEATDDPLILDIPKGSYALAVRPRTAGAEAGHGSHPATAISVVSETPARSTGRSALAAGVWALSIIALGLLVAIVYSAVTRPVQLPAPGMAPPPAVLRLFWQRFVERPELPIVVFSNAEFVGRPETGMRYFNPATDSHEAILDHYTGVGEVLAIHELDRVFHLLSHGVQLKRGRLLSLDDAKNNNLIFVGSPSENLTLREIPTTQEFVFRSAKDGPRKGDLAIANLNPRAGEETMFFGAKGLPLTEDYALIALIPGLNSGQWTLILAGTTTIGTQAAVEYVCREPYLKDMVARIGTLRNGVVSPFEAVIRVKVTGGVPVASQLVALRRRAGT
jgi:hypothetical protein